MPHDVFISHSSHDKALAEQLVGVLEKNGIRCWAAMRDALYGPTYAKQIVEAIKTSRLVVLVFSVHANDSPHIIREVEQAVDRRIPVVTMRVQDITPGDDMGYFLKVGNWMDAFNGPFEAHASKLAEQVKMLIGQAAEPKPAAPTAPPPAAAAPIAPPVPRPVISAPAGALEPPSLANRAAAHQQHPKPEKRTEKDTQIASSHGVLKTIGVAVAIAAAVVVCVFVLKDELAKSPAAPPSPYQLAEPPPPMHLTAEQVASQIHDELKPVDTIKIASAPVSKQQFDAFIHATSQATQAELDANPNTWRSAGLDADPATYVSYDEANDFIKWVNENAHRKYRLPTEAEWTAAFKASDHADALWYWSSDDFTGTEGVKSAKVICRASGGGKMEPFAWSSNHGLSTVAIRLAED